MNQCLVIVHCDCIMASFMMYFWDLFVFFVTYVLSCALVASVFTKELCTFLKKESPFYVLFI